MPVNTQRLTPTSTVFLPPCSEPNTHGRRHNGKRLLHHGPTKYTYLCCFFSHHHVRVRACACTNHATQLMKDFMDASLDNIAELVGLVDQWNNKIPATGPDEQDDAAAAAAVAAIEAGRGGGRAGVSGGSPASSTGSRSSSGGVKFKFCTECGAKIPASAKFCSECGAKQESVPAA
ncbi:unnamed protein product [Ectocarpus fasciculatus]